MNEDSERVRQVKSFQNNRKFRSAVRDLSIIPLFVMTVILIVCMISCVYSFRRSQEQLTEQTRAGLKVALTQLRSLEERVEQPFFEYVAQNENHTFLKRCTEDTPAEKTLLYQSNVRKWLDSMVNSVREVQKAFVYYENMDQFQFRGSQNYQVQQYIIKELSSEETEIRMNQWQLICMEEEWYFLYVFHINRFYGGVLMSAPSVSRTLGLGSEVYPGETYFRDSSGVNTCKNKELNRKILESAASSLGRISGTEYRNILEGYPEEDISIGLASPQIGLLKRLPLSSRLLFAAAFMSAILAAIAVLWLRTRIVKPMREIDEAMKIIAQGNLDYRLPLTDHKTYNEFDRLSVHFNAMMDELDEAQFKLYETTVREQKTRLTYISQQIRPHFILNALNIIYTYDESEFPLVKKMVMYLTRYFRYIVNLNRDFVEVSAELEHTRNYLKIQKERYPHRFDYLVECEVKAEKLLIPPLMIQTFLENSIKYGMKDDGPSFFFVNVSVQGEKAEIFIADTGSGFDEETLQKINRFLKDRQPDPTLGVGIQNTIERLDILYNGQAQLRFWNEEDGGGATISILVPVKYTA